MDGHNDARPTGPDRWKNAVKDVESDITVNINTDHYARIATIQIKLKAVSKNTGKTRPKFENVQNRRDTNAIE